MSGLASIVSDAANAALGNQKSSSTSLKDFLTKFSDSSGKYANLLNPLNTFEVCFTFYPTITTPSPSGSRDWLKDLGSSLTNSLIGAAKNAVNNITGGLLGSLLNSSEGNSVMEKHNSFSKEENGQQLSFMHYLAAANLLVGDENEWFGKVGLASKPLQLLLGYYVLSITIPLMKMPDGGKSTTLVGEFPINGGYVTTDNNLIQLTVLNTKLPLIERIFYPWMREVTLPFWSYETLPYTTATIDVSFEKHTDLHYKFYGCRPCQIEMITPNQENDQSFKRNVTMLFDFMTIESNLTTMESTTDKLLGTAGTLLNSAAGMLNMT